MNRLLSLLLLTFFFICPVISVDASDYRIQKITDSIYAAIALPNGNAASNALIVINRYQVCFAGAHFTKEGIKELIDASANISPLPLREVILTHHHKGYNFLDLDIPSNVEIVTSWQSGQALRNEFREVRNPLTLFDKGLTLQRGHLTIVLSNMNTGHSDGDVVIYFPNERVLFASDLVFNNVVGYMGDGGMREWLMNLDVLEKIGADVVVPGLGDVTNNSGVQKFQTFIREFLTEVLRHVENGDSLAKTKQEFKLLQYKQWPGYDTFFDANVEWAYKELKEK